MLRGLTKEHVDALYVIAYDLYVTAKYEEARKLFELMALYDHYDKRAWMGSAGCYEVLKNYKQAITNYSVVAMLDAENPMPFFHAFNCYTMLGKTTEALAALEAVLSLTENKSEYSELEKIAEEMKQRITTTDKRSAGLKS